MFLFSINQLREQAVVYTDGKLQCVVLTEIDKCKLLVLKQHIIDISVYLSYYFS